jgi:lysophospholipase L1-like esterase
MNLYTFGDSVLDSSAYSGATAGDLIAERLTLDLRHHASDGATSGDLDAQWDACAKEPGMALVSIGGNDFLVGQGMTTRALALLRERLGSLLARLEAVGIVAYVTKVYDPSFGSDESEVLPIPREVRASVRRNYDELNAAIAEVVAQRHATLVDLRAHFLAGDPTWYTQGIEPSARGAHEVAAAFHKAWNPLDLSRPDLPR